MKLSIRSKLAMGIIIPVVFTFITTFVTFSAVQTINTNYNLLSKANLPLSLSLKALAYLGSRINSSINELITDRFLDDEGENEDSDREINEIEENAEALTAELEAYQILLDELDLNDEERFASIKANGEELLALSASIGEVSDLSTDELVELRESLEDIERLFVNQIEAMIAHEGEQLAQSQRAVDEAVENGIRIFAVSIIAAVIIVLVAIRYLYRSITAPLGSLSETMTRFRAGDFSARSSVQSSDELGLFSATFNRMADTIQQKITETERAREQAERSDQVKSAFLASMSHELRTPLNAVINFTRFVLDGDTGPINEQQAELLTEVVGSAKHLLNLINDVLDMSKIESGSLNLFIEDDVNIGALLKSAITTGQGLLNGKPVRLDADIANDLPLVRGDKQRILQILLNVISNACKFTG